MLDKLVKLTWQDKAKQYEIFHLGKIISHKFAFSKGETLRSSWTLRDTANELGVHHTQVLKQLKLAVGMRVYPEIEKFKTAALAAEYIRKKTKGKGLKWSAPNA